MTPGGEGEGEGGTAGAEHAAAHGAIIDRLDALVDCQADLDAVLAAAVPLLDRIPLPEDPRSRRAVNALVRLVGLAARQAAWLALAADEVVAETVAILGAAGTDTPGAPDLVKDTRSRPGT